MAGGRCHKRRGSIRRLRVDGSGVELVSARRRRRPGIRVDSKGNLYVPDSEDEDSEMEVEEDGGAMAIQVLEGASRVVAEAAPGITAIAGGTGGRNISAKQHMVANKTAGEDPPVEGYPMLDSKVVVDQDVPEALREVLANMDPVYHGVFLSFYKILNHLVQGPSYPTHLRRSVPPQH